jgi:FHS family L-fucose permease-like MFS transporter
MALTPTSAAAAATDLSSTDPYPNAGEGAQAGVNAPDLQIFVFALFFIFGGSPASTT